MADLIVIEAKVYTVDGARPSAEAVVVEGNKIVFVGSNAEALAWQRPHTRVVKGGGNTLLPGLNDSHYHLLMGAERLDHLDLAAVSSLDELGAAIAQAPEAHEWIQGFGLAYNVVTDGVPLTRHHLDAIEAERPMHLVSLDFHTVWANTKALEIAGILHGGEVKLGAEIVMGEDGTATGQINEELEVVGRHIPQPTAAETRSLLRRAIAQMNALGITSVTNMDGDGEQMALYADMVAEGDFNLRIYMPYWITPEKNVAEAIEKAAELGERYRDGKVRAGSVKLFIDGVIESGTAFMLEPYTRWPESVGEPLYEQDHFEGLITEADKRGLQVKVHAIGDAAVRMTLDAYEQAERVNGRRDSRHRIEHIELLHDDDLPRFAELGVVAAMQSLHASRPAANYFMNWMNCVGEERYHRAFRWRELLDQGVSVPAGSDWPVVTFDPYLTIEAAVSQTSWGEGLINQAQTLAEVVDGYTHAAAFAEFQDEVKGQIKEGMLADLVLLDRDLFGVDVAEIRDVRPVMTICDGEVVYEK